MQKAALHTVLVALLLGGCSYAAEPCSCGEAFLNDPWTTEELAIEAHHPVSAHCLCRCGDGEAVLERPSSQCEDYEGDCINEVGEREEYTCD